MSSIDIGKTQARKSVPYRVTFLFGRLPPKKKITPAYANREIYNSLNLK